MIVAYDPASRKDGNVCPSHDVILDATILMLEFVLTRDLTRDPVADTLVTPGLKKELCADGRQ